MNLKGNDHFNQSTFRYLKKSRNLILAHLGKGHVNFSHHLATVVRKLLHLYFFFSETARPHWTKLQGSIYGKSIKKIAHFVPIEQKHDHHGRFLFLIG